MIIKMENAIKAFKENIIAFYQLTNCFQPFLSISTIFWALNK
jgi:hypothetical protein